MGGGNPVRGEGRASQSVLFLRCVLYCVFFCAKGREVQNFVNGIVWNGSHLASLSVVCTCRVLVRLLIPLLLLFSIDYQSPSSSDSSPEVACLYRYIEANTCPIHCLGCVTCQAEPSKRDGIAAIRITICIVSLLYNDVTLLALVCMYACSLCRGWGPLIKTLPHRPATP